MLLGLITLLTALAISAISAYYSVVGLTAIFAAAYWPIMIMGGVLELGKVVTTMWLHYNWERAEWKIKTYLVAAVAILMVITSMGTFGFLSKAHMDQAVPSGDIQAQVQLYDEKIKTERENIDIAKKALIQMAAAIDQILARTDDDKGASKAANLRRNQTKEREGLQREIDTAQKKIAKIQEERAPVASQYRQVVADVGPIRYIAALIYGNDADEGMLESAVRIVIILIVLVFDPLAIVLLLAATTSIDWSKTDRQKKKLEKIKEIAEQAKMTHELEVEKLKAARESAELDQELEEIKHPHVIEVSPEPVVIVQQPAPVEIDPAEIQHLIDDAVAQDRVERVPEIVKDEEPDTTELDAAREEVKVISSTVKDMTEQVNELMPLIVALEEESSELVVQNKKWAADFQTIAAEYDALLAEKKAIAAAHAETEKILSEVLAYNVELAEAKVEPVVSAAEVVTPVIVEPEPIVQQLVAPITMPLPVKRDVVMPSLSAVADNFPMGGNASFGTEFPEDPIKGDLFLRVDYMPSQLYKWSGTRWIEMDKSITDTYAYDEDYIQLLVNKIATGEQDIDDLSSTEQSQIQEFLQKQDNNG